MEMSLSFGARTYEVSSSKIRSGTILSQEEQLNNWNVKTMAFFKNREGCVYHNFSLSFQMNFQYFGYICTFKKIRLKK